MKDSGIFKAKPEAVSDAAPSPRLVGRDVEAADVFQVTDKGLWDGRPSLGGVWVAHPDVTDPERVIIRNTANSKSVIGALFRRERATPGPALQVSSDAAAALGMLAGAPAQLTVTALRREEVPESDPKVPDPKENGQTFTPEAVETSSLDPVDTPVAAVYSEPAPSPAAAQTSMLGHAYIQIGIFSVEQNAEDTANAMRQAGMTPAVRKEGSQGKTFWRVIVGPVSDAAERAALLKKIKSVGFDDAYAVND